MNRLLAVVMLVVPVLSFAASDFDTSVALETVQAMKKLQLSRVAPLPEPYSEGYRMGMLSKFSVKGWVNKSGEGELLLGQDSSVAYAGTGDDKKKINPWAFSSDVDQADMINKYAGQYVFIHYKQVAINGHVHYDTSYRLQDITPVDKSSTPKDACDNPATAGKNSKGFRIARIVKASYKGLISKSYEVMLQVGGTGNEFQAMSISDESMYKCTLRWLKSGAKAKVSYTQSFLYNPTSSNTGYDISRIEPLASLD